ncbi:MAG: hypothetical protein J0I29_16105 [Rhizobiales bacterium]|nr:hypothetical protein [Hyphomicrobiales bacterium]
MFDLPTKIWWANEIRIWGVLATAFIGMVSFAATWAHSRWQAELSDQKEARAIIERRESDERIAEAQARAAEANQKAEAERLERIKIEERLADRKITDQQFATIVAKVKDYAGQQYEVVTYWDSREPLALANRIANALNLAGWVLSQPQNASFMLGGHEGIEVFYHPEAGPKILETAKAIADALTAEGLSAKLRQKNAPGQPDNKINFNVGTKPN